jgi:hypothetical protein
MFALGRLFLAVSKQLRLQLPNKEAVLYLEPFLYQIKKILAETGLFDSSKMTLKDDSSVINKGTQLLSLAFDSSIAFSGKKIEPIALATCLITLRPFCVVDSTERIGMLAKQLLVDAKATVRRIHELESVLYEKAKVLPWSSSISKKNVLDFTNDILKYGSLFSYD